MRIIYFISTFESNIFSRETFFQVEGKRVLKYYVISGLKSRGCITIVTLYAGTRSLSPFDCNSSNGSWPAERMLAARHNISRNIVARGYTKTICFIEINWNYSPVCLYINLKMNIIRTYMRMRTLLRASRDRNDRLVTNYASEDSR